MHYNKFAVFFRGVAQVVERLLREQEAVGSSPATPTRIKQKQTDPALVCFCCMGFFISYHS